MKIVTVVNGTTSIYIQPESEMDKLILAEISKGPVEIKQHTSIQVGDKQMVDCIQILPVKPIS